MYDWTQESDVNPSEKRVEALELSLINFINACSIMRDNGNIRRVRTLNFFDLGLTSFPNVLEKYTWLTKLVFAKNALTAIPYGLPSSLTHLYIYNNRITGRNAALEDLPEKCVVDLEDNPLSIETIDFLNQRCTASDYHGPRIHFSMQPEVIPPLFPAELTLPEVLSKWGIVDTADWENIKNEENFPHFLIFLHRLGQTINFSNPDFRKNVADFLTKLFSNSPDLRAHVFRIAEEATSFCEDRVSLAYNYMSIVYVIRDIEEGKYDDRVEKIIELARGMFRLDKLDEIARKQVKKFNFCDEVEVFLAYQVKLQRRLLLPVETPDMRFFKVSWITPEDLDAAEQTVKAAEQTDFLCFLATEYSPWLSLIKRQALSSYQNMQKEKDKALENLEQVLDDQLKEKNLPRGHDDGKIIVRKILDESLIKLTEKFLGERKISI